MSNYLAIATVTATLKELLNATVSKDLTGATATTLRPHDRDKDHPEPGVNLYLYQVTPNSAWSNGDLPTRTGDGRLVQRPRVALDLHYLFSFYGADKLLEPQRILGSVVRTLHAEPLLLRQRILATIKTVTDGDANHFLSSSDLAEEVELVKMTPLSLSLEELSKLWSVFFQTPYVLSVAYQATAVLIEGEQTPSRVLPVRKVQIWATPLRSMTIEQVVAAQDENQPLVFGDTLLIKGRNLSGAGQVNVRVGDVMLTPATASGGQISVLLTDNALRAGLQGVQVFEETPIATLRNESNTVALMLHPQITPDAASVSATVLPVHVQPAVGRRQRVVLYLNELDAPPERTPHAYTFPAPANQGITDLAVESTNTIAFAINDVVAGVYLVRVQVDGADSLLASDPDDDRYRSPRVTIP